jgi:DNA-binding NarL/FixJ family response regulator
MKKIKLFIAEDHKIVLEGMCSLFKRNSAIDITGVAGDGEQMFELLKLKQPDVLLLDDHLPGENGAGLLPVVREHYPGIKVIYLSMSVDYETITNAIKGGAKGFLHKGIDYDELLLAIEEVSGGKEYYSAEVSNLMVKSFTKKVKYVAGSNSENNHALSRREKEILAYIREGYSNSEIASLCGLSIRTVEGHKDKMKRKLNLKKGADLIIYALKNH